MSKYSDIDGCVGSAKEIGKHKFGIIMANARPISHKTAMVYSGKAIRRAFPEYAWGSKALVRKWSGQVSEIDKPLMSEAPDVKRYSSRVGWHDYVVIESGDKIIVFERVSGYRQPEKQAVSDYAPLDI